MTSMLSWAKKELAQLKFCKPKRLLLTPTSFSSAKSLPMPPVQEVVLAADMLCACCRKRVATVISGMEDMESMVIDVSEKKITITRRMSI